MRIYLPLPVDWDEDDELTGLPDLGEDGYLAQLLALGMLLYCKRRLSDGRVPLAQPARIMHRLPTERVGQLVKHLLDSCFITEQAGAWQVCNYTANYGSRADAERRSEQRRSAGALGGRARAKRRGHGPALAGAQANAKHLLERGQATLARTESETESDIAPVVPTTAAPERDNAWADLGGRNEWTTPPRSGTRHSAEDRSPAGRQPSARSVSDVLRRTDGDTAPPATDEQRAKRAAEIREALAAAAPRGAVLESGSGQHEPEPEHQDQLALGEPADAEPPY